MSDDHPITYSNRLCQLDIVYSSKVYVGRESPIAPDRFISRLIVWNAHSGRTQEELPRSPTRHTTFLTHKRHTLGYRKSQDSPKTHASRHSGNRDSSLSPAAA